jgi:sigma-B regulation protein RsbU (phosphoserine phosphatase)
MSPAEPHAPLKVLVAEDEKASREALRKAVKMLGHDCRVAADGLDALRIHESERVDVILSAWRLPRMDGLELCRRTRPTKPSDPYTYFILLTGFDDRDRLLEGMGAGVDDFQSKPINLDELQVRLVAAARVLSLHAKLAEKGRPSIGWVALGASPAR